jgi:heme-degrading monooxygenase HmoA
MPKLPWASINEVESDTDVTIMGSRLPLRSHLAVPGFLLAAQRIRKQLKGSEGLVGYALDARLLEKAFWTVSAWTSREHLERFDRADPHHAATGAIRPKMEPSTFVFWSGKARDLPVPWNEVERRIAEREADRTTTEPAEPPATPDDAEG